MIVQTATVIINMVARAVPDFRLGHRPPMGVAGAALSSLIAIAVGVVWLTLYFSKPTAYLRLPRRRLEAAMSTCGARC